MAGEWIKIETALPAKSEVIRIGRALGLSPEAVCGWLIRFWGWASANSVDGVVDGLETRDIDLIVSLPGFAEALVLVGWLKFDVDEKRLIVPNFTRHNGESAKKRALKSSRQARWRDSKVDAHVDAHVDAAVVKEASLEKRREEKSKPKSNTTPGAKAPDPAKEEIWKTGKALLEAGGFDLKAAGSFLGKLCKEYGQVLVLQAIRDCVQCVPAEPHTWLIARCQERRKGNGKFNVIQSNREDLARELAAEKLGVRTVSEVQSALPAKVHG